MAKRRSGKDTGEEVKITPGAFGSQHDAENSDGTVLENLENIDIQESYSKAETFINNNKGLVFGGIALLFLLVGGYYAYNNVYKPPIEANAMEKAIKAQEYFGIDSFNLALNGDGNYDGFIDIADDYSGTKMGKLANYYAGICNLHLGQFDDAISYLGKFNGKDMIVSSMALGAIGDAYMQKGDQSNGINYYEKAINNSKNTFTSPMYHLRAGIAKEQQSDFAGAKVHFETIKNEFPESTEANEVDKYLSKIANN